MGQGTGKDILFRYSAGYYKKGDQGAEHPAVIIMNFRKVMMDLVNEGERAGLLAAIGTPGCQGIVYLADIL